MIPIGMFAEAWTVLRENPLRSALTMLGIVVGVGAVIIMLAVITGVNAEYKRQLESMGSNTLLVYTSVKSGHGMPSDGSEASLTLGDAQAIGSLESVAQVAPLASLAGKVTYAARSRNTSVVGATVAYLAIKKWTLSSGVSFSDAEMRSGNRVALLGQSVAQDLFGKEFAAGKTIQINRQPFRVIGVLDIRGGGEAGSLDDCIIVPIRTAHQQLMPRSLRGRVNTIDVEARSSDVLEATKVAIMKLLRFRHRVRDEGGEDFGISDMTQFNTLVFAVQRGRALTFAAVGSISLLVGGIGIMNVMLVSVAERTREIGLRKALGATRAMILVQFLTESIALAIAGCTAGVTLGMAISGLLSWLANTPTVVTGISVLAAAGVSMAVGLFFGWYPALRAARLDPIEALRYQ